MPHEGCVRVHYPPSAPTSGRIGTAKHGTTVGPAQATSSAGAHMQIHHLARADVSCPLSYRSVHGVLALLVASNLKVLAPLHEHHATSTPV